jgi:hypothetical protein
MLSVYIVYIQWFSKCVQRNPGVPNVGLRILFSKNLIRVPSLAQAVTSLLPRKPSFDFNRPCGIYGRRSGTWTGFSPSIPTFPLSFHRCSIPIFYLSTIDTPRKAKVQFYAHIKLQGGPGWLSRYNYSLRAGRAGGRNRFRGPRGVRRGSGPIACAGCGFESRRGHGCLCCTVRTKGQKPGQSGQRSSDKVQTENKTKSWWGARFSAPVQTDPGAHPASYTMGTGSLSRVYALGHGVNQPPPFSAEVKERVQVYLYFPSRPSRPVVGWTL